MKGVNSPTATRAARNQKLRKYFARLQQERPSWRYDALLEDTAARFDLSPRTVRAIVNREGAYQD